MIDPDYINFESMRDGVRISISVCVDSDLEGMCDAFRSFLLAVGHHPDNVAALFDEGSTEQGGWKGTADTSGTAL